ncbi:hypothetical protein B484DRAFT_427118 [Ochromonadaceae sp. CCMP2298]|nr:hypothetical protein B484DRAFT_427118 [Ochromonadaceae sp. CCMP2298]
MCGGLPPRRLLDFLSFMNLWLYTEDIQKVVGSKSWSADRIFNQHPELARRAQALFAKMAEPFHGDPFPAVGLGGAPACKHLPSDAVTVAASVDHPSCGLRFATCFLAQGNPQERLARFIAVDDGYSLLGKAATGNPGFVQHQFVNKLNGNPLTEADIAAIKRGQVRGGQIGGATDWSDGVRLASGAPEGMTKWGQAGATDWSDGVRLASGASEGMTSGQWRGVRTGIVKRAARTPPVDASFRWCNVSGCREVGWVGLQVVHKFEPRHTKRIFGLHYSVARREDWNLQVEAEAEAEADRYQSTSAVHEEHEYRDWTAEDLEDAGL